MDPLIKRKATYLGLGALGMWTIEPLLISEVNSLPIFELLSIIFASSFVITAIRITLKRKWHLIWKQSLFIWIAGCLGICLSDFVYILGSQYAPIAHVDLIDYIWPCLAICFTSCLPREKMEIQHIIGALLGFVGIYFLISEQVHESGANWSYIFGYGLAIVGAILWGGYTAFTRHFREVPTEMVGMYCGLGAVICFILHIHFESFVMPSVPQGSLAVLTGVTGAGLAYQLWDYGVKHGDVYLLNVMTYIARICAMALLVFMGKEPFAWSLVMACALATLGVFVSSTSTKTYIKLYKKLKPKQIDVSCDVQAEISG